MSSQNRGESYSSADMRETSGRLLSEDETSPLLKETLAGKKETTNETLLETLTSCRWTLAYVGFICMLLLYALRINMAIAIVCMVKASNVSVTNHSSACGVQSLSGGRHNSSDLPQGTGDIAWDKTMQGWILSSLFYGYLVTQIPGGYLAGKYGGKRVMFVGMIGYGLSTILVPAAARFDGVNYLTSAYLVIALRVIAGLSTGVVFPAMQNLCGRWAPPYERSKIYGLISSGAAAGNILMLGAGGFFCEWTTFDGGWPSIFYLGGGCCLIFCLLWWFIVYDSPSEHPRISEKERRHILSAMETVDKGKNSHVPWREMLKSSAVWAIVVAGVCNNFGNYTLLTNLPTFMKDVLDFEITENGLLSTLPYIARFMVQNVASQIIDILRSKQMLSTVAARKLSMICALAIPAAFLAAIGNVPCNMNYLAVIFLTAAVGFTGFNTCGFNTNPQDIAPRYAGEIFAIANTFASIPGMVAPPVISAMTVNGTAAEWRTVFYIWTAIFVFGAVFYTIFAKGEIQPWAAEKKDSRSSAEPEDAVIEE